MIGSEDPGRDFAVTNGRTCRRAKSTVPQGDAGDGRSAGRRVPSSRRTLASQVRERLLADIWSGRWQPGDHLPTEVEMMALFGVSRTPIREAMQSLDLLGLVDISPRRGATVRALSLESVVGLAILSGSMASLRSVPDVFEFRHAMEGAIAALAARHASPEQVDDLREILVENQTAVAVGDGDAAREIDIRFHSAIAMASGNVVFQTITHALNGLLVELRRITGGIPGASAASYSEHCVIVDAIAAHDPSAARRAAEAHIDQTRRRYESTVRSVR